MGPSTDYFVGDRRTNRERMLAGDLSIGDNSGIGAGSIGTRRIPANVIAVGKPAGVVCSI